ncbi:MAG TPA: hypothetical protein VLC11_04610 [Gemmatimonadales bacterium]|nr:hypothetical protein [Gemmatimonadales bacterium]
MGFLKIPQPVLIPGEVTEPVNVASTGTTIPNYGQTIVKSTVALRTYVLQAPTAGVNKVLFCTNATTSLLAKVTFGSAVSVFANVGQGSTLHSVKFNHPNQSISLMGLSSTRWLITGSNNSPTLSTSS